MTQFEQLDNLMEANEGLLLTKEVVSAGISKPVFYDYVKSRDLHCVGHGMYLSRDAWWDPFYLLHLSCPQIIFSHDVALYFHDLTDREPMQHTVTVKTGYNPSRLKKNYNAQVYTVKEDLYKVGLITMKTDYGHDVPIYDMERTICDVIRSRRNIEIQTYQDALKWYVRSRDKNLRRLMNYAELFHVEKMLRQYLLVLL